LPGLGRRHEFTLMSRAFVNEDAGGPEPRYRLPKRDDPGYDEAAAWALIEGAYFGVRPTPDPSEPIARSGS
jgi:hypothetical protein